MKVVKRRPKKACAWQRQKFKTRFVRNSIKLIIFITGFYVKTYQTILLGSFIVAAAFSSAAFAEDQGFYAGANLGIGKPNINTPNGLDKSSSAVGGALLGYKFNKYVGVEGEYTGIGKVTDKVNGTAKGDAASLAVIGFLPLNDEFNLYGKLGVAHTKTTVSSSLAPMSDATRTAVTYGFGGEYNFNKNVGMRLGWDHYNAAVDMNGANKNNANANVISVGAIYNF
jgi:OmpA-OmpF porin, OOP family